MSKKASRKFYLNVDLDDVERDYYEDLYYWNDDDETEEDQHNHKCTNVSGRQKKADKKTVKSPKRLLVNSNKESANSKSSLACSSHFKDTTPQIKLYHKRQLGRPFSNLLLDRGHESVLFVIASFLGMRSISALSCTNKCWERMLANSDLYCQQKSSCAPLLLPCCTRKNIPLSSSCASEVARSLALESTLFSKEKSQKRNRTLREAFAISPAQLSILESKLSNYGSTVTYLTNRGKVVSYKLSNNFSKNNVNIKPILSRQMVPRDCSEIEIISSFCSSKYCAILFMPSTGVRRYTLSVVALDSSAIMANWQHDFLSNPALNSTSLAITLAIHGPSRYFSVKMDSDHQWVAVVFRCHLFVFSLSDSNLVWEHVLSSKECQDWDTWVFHKRYIIATAGSSRRYSRQVLMIYCVDSKRLVALGRTPQHNSSVYNRQNDASLPPIIVHKGRIYFACQYLLRCTGLIFRRLDRTKAATTTDDTVTNVPVLQIKQLYVLKQLADIKLQQPTLLAQFNDAVYLTNGNLVETWQDVCIENTKPVFTSYQVLSADGIITSLQVDSTKIVCGIKDERKHRIEIFLRPEVAAAVNNALYYSVFVKSASVFLDRFQFRNVEFQGGRLLIETQRPPVGSTILAQESRIQIFDLFDWDD